MSSLALIFQLLILTLLLYFIYLLLYSMIRGAPYASIGKKRLRTVLDLLDMKKGDFIDIGSGDGRIVIEAAKCNIRSCGIEINPILYIMSLLKIKKWNVVNAEIIFGDCFKHSYAKYNYISVWGTEHMMKNLEPKLLRELKPGARVVSNHFKFPNWKPKKVKDDVYLYIR